MMMEEQAIKTLSDLLLTKENLIIMVASWFLIAVAKRVLPNLFKKPFMARILPMLPMVLCMGLIWLPGLRPPTAWGATLVTGIVLGWGVGQLHKVLAQSVLGKDEVIKNGKKPPPAAVHVDEKGAVTTELPEDGGDE
jgi:hypothetical protein